MSNREPKSQTWFAYSVSDFDHAADLGAYLSEKERDTAIEYDIANFGAIVAGEESLTVTVGTVVANDLDKALDAIRLEDWATVSVSERRRTR
jgi:hypothetical protein